MVIGIGIGALEISVVGLLGLALIIPTRRLVMALRSSGRVDWVAAASIAVVAVIMFGFVHLVREHLRERAEERAQLDAEQLEDEATLAALRDAPPDRFAQAKATMCAKEAQVIPADRIREVVERVDGQAAHLSDMVASMLDTQSAAGFAAWVSLCVADSRSIELRSDAGSLGFWSLDSGFSPGPALAPAPALTPVVETVVASYSGRGQKKPQPFAVRDRWEVRWKAKGAAFSLMLYTADGQLVDLLANGLGADESSAFVPQGGEYYLDIRGMGRWSVEVVQLP